MDGKTRTYKALVLFHNPAGSTEELKPEFWDSVVGMGGAINAIFKEQRVPVGAHKLSAKESNDLSSRNPREENQMLGDSENDKAFALSLPQSNKNAQKRVQNGLNNVTTSGRNAKFGQKHSEFYMPDCFDGDPCLCTFSDFGWSWDPECWGPFPPDGGGDGGGGDNGCTASATSTHPQSDDHDNKYHSSNGRHWATTQFSAGCTVDASCTQTCQVLVDTAIYGDDHYDTTELLFNYHVGGKKNDTQSASGPKGTQITCKGGVGYAFNECISSDCPVNVEVGWTGAGASTQLTTSGGDLWTSSQQHIHTCQ